MLNTQAVSLNNCHVISIQKPGINLLIPIDFCYSVRPALIESPRILSIVFRPSEPILRLITNPSFSGPGSGAVSQSVQAILVEKVMGALCYRAVPCCDNYHVETSFSKVLLCLNGWKINHLESDFRSFGRAAAN